MSLNMICVDHSQPNTLICNNCTETICYKCVSTTHRGHTFDDLDTALNNLCLEENFTQLNTWITEKTNMSKEIDSNIQEVISTIAKLHEQLILLEHRLKTPLLTEREELQSQLTIHIDQLDLYKRVFKKQGKIDDVKLIENIKNKLNLQDNNNNNNNNNKNNNREDSVGSDDEQVKDFYDEFGDVAENPQVANNHKNDSDNESEITLEDLKKFQLFNNSLNNNKKNNNSSISNASSIYQSNINNSENDQKLRRKNIIKINEIELNKVKSTLNYIFIDNKLEKNQRVNDTHLFISGLGGCFKYSIRENRWTKLSNIDAESRIFLANSNVRVGELLYVFGGSMESKTYSIFNFNTFEWESQLAIATEVGLGTATCYVEDTNAIYLIGGNHQNTLLSRVDRFDLNTKQVSHVGNIGNELRFGRAFHHHGILYVVGGSMYGGIESKSLLSFNLTTNLSSVYIDDIGAKQSVFACCFDGSDLIYILDFENNFYTLSLSSKTSTPLASPAPLKPYDKGYKCPIIILNNSIYLISGREYANHHYSITENTWVKISDADVSLDKRWFAATSYSSSSVSIIN